MLIFVDQISERLIYTFNFIFNERGIAYSFTNDWKNFTERDVPKFIYSDHYDEKYLMIQPSSLLFDEQIHQYTIDKGLFIQHECLSFNHVSDPFASVFYILSRYEEYTCKLKDHHERFPAKESVLIQYNWVHHAICDRWAVAILEFLSEKISLAVPEKKMTPKIIPSFDIDNTYAFKWKKGWRKWFSHGRDFIKKDEERLMARKQFFKGQIDDPYDTFDYIRQITSRGFESKIFWLFADYGSYDKNISTQDVRHQRLIKILSKELDIGIHPSYESNKSLQKLKQEITQLERVLGKKITSSRQHFLKLKLPLTYHSLMEIGVTDDYTMGFAEFPGFRAGTARPFYFFDLSTNAISNLLVHPFVYMDGTLLEYKQFTIPEAKEVVKKLYEEVSSYGGDFIFIWHNETIGDFGKWKGWREVLEFTLQLGDVPSEPVMKHM